MTASMWFLTVFMLVDGQWVRGDKVDIEGWTPRAYETREICETRKEFAMRAIEQSRLTGKHMAESRWLCAEGSPPETLPEDVK